MRKILFVLVVLSMLLAACAPAATPAPAPAATTAPAAAPAAAAGNSAVKPTGFGDILKGVLARGKLKCGINPSNPGFSVIDSSGAASGLDIEMCRAVAAAVLGDAKLVE